MKKILILLLFLGIIYLIAFSHNPLLSLCLFIWGCSFPYLLEPLIFGNKEKVPKNLLFEDINFKAKEISEGFYVLRENNDNILCVALDLEYLIFYCDEEGLMNFLNGYVSIEGMFNQVDEDEVFIVDKDKSTPINLLKFLKRNENLDILKMKVKYLNYDGEVLLGELVDNSH